MRDPYIREKFTRNIVAARELAREYFERYPKERYNRGGNLARNPVL